MEIIGEIAPDGVLLPDAPTDDTAGAAGGDLRSINGDSGTGNGDCSGDTKLEAVIDDDDIDDDDDFVTDFGGNTVGFANVVSAE
jgi:hypothetical protein